MKYCKKCGTLYKSNYSICKDCNKELCEISDKNTPVYLITANGFEKSRIEGALRDVKIPFSEKADKNESGATMIIGNTNENATFYVPYSAYKKACETLIGIGAMESIDSDILTEIENELALEKAADTDKHESQPQFNRGATIALMLIMLALVAAVVWGVDAIMAWLEGFFRY